MFSPIPDKRNSPPRIIPGTVYPGKVDWTYGLNCPLVFAVGVEDPDISDPIRVRWSVYGPNETPEIFFQMPGTIPTNGKAVRDVLAAAKDVPILGTASSELVQNGPHRLEVFISDGEFGAGPDDSVARPRNLPDGGTVNDPTYTDSHVWFVTTDSTAACPP